MRSFNQAITQIHAMGIMGEEILIGHLDTGVDGAHLSLRKKIAAFQRFGYRGFAEEAISPIDSREHGTHIAGLLVGSSSHESAATDCLGIAPSAQLCSGMVIEEGNLIARVLSGLDWLIDCQVKVVNLALGVSSETPIFRTLIQEMIARDVVVVCSIGNQGAGKSTSPGSYPEVISVGALDIDGVRVAPFSGSSHPKNSTVCIKPDIVAPGVDILSSVPGNKTARKCGTSMAAAQVAGLAALLRQAFPEATNTLIKSALIESCAPCLSEQSHRSAYGIVRPVQALEWLSDWQRGDKASIFSRSHSLSIEGACFPQQADKYVDDRLIMQLKMAITSNHLCEAIFQFASWADVNCLRQLLESHYGTDDIKTHYKPLKYAPLAICRAPKEIITRVLAWPSVYAASACDLDRLK